MTAKPEEKIGNGQQRRPGRRARGRGRLRAGQGASLRGSEPLEFRSRHDPLDEGRPALERNALRIADADGNVSHPHRVFDTLAALRRNGSIDEREYAAARQFQDDWERARLDPLSIPDLDRTLGRYNGELHLSELMLRARQQVWQALRGLGGHASPIGQAAWHVLGWGLTVKEFAQRSQLGGGRALDEKTARGLVVGACGVLAGWYDRRGVTARRRA